MLDRPVRGQRPELVADVEADGGDRLIPSSEGERLARETSVPSEFIYYEEGNHVCFNISYKFRPLSADWLADHL